MDEPSSLAYHLTLESWYQSLSAEDAYLPEAYTRDGFVHLTLGIDRVMEVGNRYYRGEAGRWLLLSIDLRQVQADVRYDDPESVFPHVYGPLDRAAIVAVHPVERDVDGRFTGIGPALPRRD